VNKLWIAGVAFTAAAAATLTPRTGQAFARYAASVESDFQRAQPFLDLDSDPAAKRRVMAGETVVRARHQMENGKPLEIPDAQIQDWYGAALLPCTLERAAQILQDYPNYKVYYKPDVTDSKLLSRQGNDFRVFLQLYRKQILTVVLNSYYSIHYQPESGKRLRIISRSTRISEVKNGQETSPEDSYGFLWTLNSYWKLEETPGGVIAECRALSLSRDIPLGLGWLLRDFVKKFPRESMEHTLEGTRRAAAGNIVTLQ
jgi:hypothetical protein